MRSITAAIEPALIKLLTDRARANLPCTTNLGMAHEIGGCSESMIVKLLRSLTDRGIIIVHRKGHQRVIEFPHLGIQTAPNIKKKLFNVVHNQADWEDLKQVSRDPCFKCGTRMDLGCKHFPLEIAA